MRFCVESAAGVSAADQGEREDAVGAGVSVEAIAAPLVDDAVAAERHPLAAHESPCVRLQRVVRFRCLLGLRLPVLPVGNTRVRRLDLSI